MLGQCAPHNCAVYRITEEHDFRQMVTVNQVIRKATQHKNGTIHLHISLPCSGGSPAQNLNRHIGRGQSQRESYWKDLPRFLVNRDALLHALRHKDPCAVVERPQTNDYWRDPRVKRILRKHRLIKVPVNGCQYDLRCSRRGPHYGLLVKTLWFSRLI